MFLQCKVGNIPSTLIHFKKSIKINKLIVKVFLNVNILIFVFKFWIINKIIPINRFVFYISSKEVLKDIIKSSTGHLSKKDIYAYISCESTGLRIDEFYMVYRAILNTSSRKASKSKRHKDQIEDVFVVIS